MLPLSLKKEEYWSEDGWTTPMGHLSFQSRPINLANCQVDSKMPLRSNRFLYLMVGLLQPFYWVPKSKAHFWWICSFSHTSLLDSKFHRFERYRALPCLRPPCTANLCLFCGFKYDLGQNVDNILKFSSLWSFCLNFNPFGQLFYK